MGFRALGGRVQGLGDLGHLTSKAGHSISNIPGNQPGEMKRRKRKQSSELPPGPEMRSRKSRARTPRRGRCRHGRRNIHAGFDTYSCGRLREKTPQRWWAPCRMHTESLSVVPGCLSAVVGRNPPLLCSSYGTLVLFCFHVSILVASFPWLDVHGVFACGSGMLKFSCWSGFTPLCSS